MSPPTRAPVFFIGQHEADEGLTPETVGGKAANLARIARLGLPVPPAVAVGTAVCRDYYEHGGLSSDVQPAIAAAVRQLEAASGLTLGQRNPLLVSVRSSPTVSMPGMLDTVLNVGLTAAGVRGLIRRTGNPWLAWDAYRRLVGSYAETVLGLERQPFDRLTATRLAAADARAIQELDPISLRSLAGEAAGLLQALSGAPLPADPLEQILAAVEAVLRSWNSRRAREYRTLNGIGDGAGTGVLVQLMVFGNAGARSGSGVGFTRDPATGRDDMYVDFLFNAQGEDVVSGRQAVLDTALLPIVLPDVWSDLASAKAVLEREFLDMQDFEFTVSEGRLFFLQTRSAKRTPWAALQVATDLVRDGLIDPAIGLERLEAYRPRSHRTRDSAGGRRRCARRIPPCQPASGSLSVSLPSTSSARRGSPGPAASFWREPTSPPTTSRACQRRPAS